MSEAVFMVVLAVACAWGWRVHTTGWVCEACGKKQDFFATPWLNENGCVCIDCSRRTP